MSFDPIDGTGFDRMRKAIDLAGVDLPPATRGRGAGDWIIVLRDGNR